MTPFSPQIGGSHDRSIRLLSTISDSPIYRLMIVGKNSLYTADGICVLVGVRVGVRVAVVVGVAVRVGVGVEVRVAVGVQVWVGVGVAV